MSRLNVIWQLFMARLREFFREPEAIFWVYGFPVLLAIGLGIAFSSRKPEPPLVDVQELSDSAEGKAVAAYLNEHGVKAEIHDEAACRNRLRDAKTALFVVPERERYRYVFDDTRPEGVAARYQVDDLVQRWKSGTAAWPAVGLTTSSTIFNRSRSAPSKTWRGESCSAPSPLNAPMTLVSHAAINAPYRHMASRNSGSGYHLLEQRPRRSSRRALTR